ncbi:hypothetical protein CDAR_67861 [Caerostris darwini]|uniref:Uncharacterized protein n=1 Tax=Caerostris darwini TaxID=1538125 RepID=A0AAV4VTH9_9ARAC|nr:hypothetical protein CDAR_67861 [Caerostris darwini]
MPSLFRHRNSSFFTCPPSFPVRYRPREIFSWIWPPTSLKDDVEDHSTRMLLESGARLNALPFQAPELQFLYLSSKFSCSLSSAGDIFLDMVSNFPSKSGISERLHTTIQCLKDKRMLL